MILFPKEHIVSNTGPLISLENLPDGFNFIRKLYKKIIIPQRVLEELSVKNFASTDEYINYHNIKDLLEVTTPTTKSKIIVGASRDNSQRI